MQILKADFESGYITKDTYDKQKIKTEKLIKKEKKIKQRTERRKEYIPIEIKKFK